MDILDLGNFNVGDFLEIFFLEVFLDGFGDSKLFFCRSFRSI